MKAASRLVVLSIAAVTLNPLSNGQEPLKEGVCPKYQHDISFNAVIKCRFDSEDKGGFVFQCDKSPATEKEWQEILSRIQDLEINKAAHWQLDVTPVPVDNVVGEHYDGKGVEFPSNPAVGDNWKAPNGKLFGYNKYGWWPINPQVKIKACTGEAHLHPKGMKTDLPDIINGPLPKGDNRCHSDKTDEEVGP